MTPAETRNAVAHLLRRAAFGGHADEIDALAAGGYEAAVDALGDASTPDAAADAITPPTFDTAAYLAARGGDVAARQAARRGARQERRQLIGWWLQRMAVADYPYREKVTLLWHDHFATSVQKVKLAELMFVQRRTLYELGLGRFDTLASAMVRDPAMLVWLDGRESTAEAPNENFAREFLELFTLGHGGHHGAQPYGERDVAEAARAFTGWRPAPDFVSSALAPRRHDSGVKTVLSTTGSLGSDEVVALATAHPACAPYVVARLWSRLARPAEPDDPVVIELAASFAQDLDIGGLLRRIFLHREFLAPASRWALVKTPIEYVIGTARALRRPVDRRVAMLLGALGQVPFVPPDVAGWPANEGWLATSSALTRLQLAVTMVDGADLTPIEQARPTDRPAAAARLLGVDGWGPTSAATLRAAAGDPRTLLTVALVAPEHVLA